MKHSIIRLMALILTITLLLGLMAGCGKTGSAGDGADVVYVPTYEQFPGEYRYMGSACVSGDTLYFSADVTDPEDVPPEDADEYYYPNTITKLFKMDLTTREVSELSDYTPLDIPAEYDAMENVEGRFYMNNIFVDGDGSLWVNESGWFSRFDFPEGVTYETADDPYQYYQDLGSVSVLRNLDATGKELGSLDLTAFVGKDTYIQTVAVDAAGNIYLTDGSTFVNVVGSDGSEICELPISNWVDGFVPLNDGTMAAIGYWDSGMEIRPIDLSAKNFKDNVGPNRDFDSYSIYPASGEYDFLYTSGDNLFAHKSGSEDVKLLSWINCDISTDSLSAVIPREDGVILCVTATWDDTYDNQIFELVTLTPTDPATLANQTTLTLACQYLDYEIRALVIDFNKTHSDVRIEIKDYSEFNTDEDYSAGLTKLTTEILSGQVPDLLLTSTLPIDRYVAKGLLEDLYPYIDADTELGGRDAVVPSALKAMEIDGILPQVVSSFSVYTLVADASVVGDEPGWTTSDMLALATQLPQGVSLFDQYSSRESMIGSLLIIDADQYIDWVTGECHFDSQGFIDILKFAAMFPSSEEIERMWDDPDFEWESSYKRIMDGSQLLFETAIYDFYTMQEIDAVYGDREYTFIGFPVSQGVGNLLSPDSGVAMSSTCKDKDAAWSFIRTLLTYDYQKENSWSLPSNRQLFDEKLEDACTPTYTTDPETGETVEESYGGIMIDDGIEIRYTALSKEAGDKLRDLVFSIDRTFTYDESLLDIITEEAAPFFAGQKSAEEVADLIQSRMNIYVNEQR